MCNRKCKVEAVKLWYYFVKPFLHYFHLELRRLMGACVTNFNQILCGNNRGGFDNVYQACGCDFTVGSPQNLVSARWSCNFIIVKPARTFGHKKQMAAKLGCVREENKVDGSFQFKIHRYLYKYDSSTAAYF